MKGKEFIGLLESQGCYLLRHGSRHDIYFNPNTGKSNPYQGIQRLTTNL